jgi:L-arabinose isomerase
MTDPKRYEVWFAVGSQHLYGESAIRAVDAHAAEIIAALEASGRLPVRLVLHPALTSADAIRRLCLDASAATSCVGVIAWMHTFSPAKMWIAGIQALQKPLLHLHTQFNRELPWAEIDMDFMNLNQSAHGDREFGYLLTRLRRERATVVGHWGDERVQKRVGTWARAATGRQAAHDLRIARFGDNMRDVAVTEGDKVEAQIRLGVSVNSYGVSDLARASSDVSDTDAARLAATYEEEYDVDPVLRHGGERHASLRDAARIEIALRAFLEEGDFGGFTDTFEDLGDLPQLPGIAVQRLMADGYGFGAEGDWKAAVLVRLMKVMGEGLPGGTSFMEDYTYHLAPSDQRILGAHMLEVCPSIAADRASCEIHPLSIGGKADPVRLVFTAKPGPAVVAGLVDMGDRLRIVANEVQVVAPSADLPRLPVARAVWQPLPDLATAAEAWLTAGGPHHTGLSAALRVEHLAEFAEMAGIEFIAIDSETRVPDLKRELRWNEAAYRAALH